MPFGHLPSDFHRDVLVDAADFTFWPDAIASNDARPDDNEHDVAGVEHEQYDLWKANFGVSSGGGSVARVSELSTAGILLVGILANSFARRRQHCRPSAGPAIGPHVRCSDSEKGKTMYLPKVLTFHGSSELSLASMLALLVASLCSATSSAQTPNVNDLAYATVTNDDGSPATLRLDLWQSTTGSGPARLVIWIHPGAWLGGTYNSPPPPLQPLLQSGFAVASVQYRFSGAAIFPAQIHDVKGAVRFLRAHADQYNLDPTRFAAWGSSSGGHLAALLATSGDVAEAEGTTGGNPTLSSRLQAAVDYFGPTDLLQMNLDVTTPPGSIINHDAPNSPESQLIGFDGAGEGIGVLRNNLSNPNPPFPEKAALVRLANPIEHVTPGDPPVFIAHGNQDTLVPMNQSVRLATALDAAGIEYVMRVVVGAGHGFGTQDATVNAEAIAFLTAQFARIPGDFNGDDTVDDADYLLWKQDFGTNRAAADGNGNGIVDAADYTVWRDHLGTTAGSGAGAIRSTIASVAIPEATSLALAMIAVTLLLAAHAHLVSAANRR